MDTNEIAMHLLLDFMDANQEHLSFHQEGDNITPENLGKAYQTIYKAIHDAPQAAERED
jgi:hypothetical protein